MTLAGAAWLIIAIFLVGCSLAAFLNLDMRDIHRMTRGRIGKHNLQGGWCPDCGCIYIQPNWIRQKKRS